MNYEDITGVLLAGGQSRRFGSNKAFIPWKNNNLLIESILNVLDNIFLQNMVLVKNTVDYKFLNTPGTKVIQDLFSDFHPLGGIYSALKHSNTEHIFVCACDMPYLKAALIKRLVAETADNGYDATIPVFNNKPQPLCGIYSRKCMQSIKEMIGKDNLRIQDLFNVINVNLIKEENISKVDPKGASFLDIDTREDYIRLLKEDVHKTYEKQSTTD